MATPDDDHIVPAIKVHDTRGHPPLKVHGTRGHPSLDDLEMGWETPVRPKTIDSLDPRTPRTDPQFGGKRLQRLELPSRVNLDRPIRPVPDSTPEAEIRRLTAGPPPEAHALHPSTDPKAPLVPLRFGNRSYVVHSQGVLRPRVYLPIQNSRKTRSRISSVEINPSNSSKAVSAGRSSADATATGVPSSNASMNATT